MKKYLGIICLLYSLLLFYLIKTNLLKNFLAPNMHIYIIFTLFILFIMFLVNVFSDNKHTKFIISDLVLLLPIALIIISGDGKLTIDFVSNRSSNINMEFTKKIDKKVSKKEANKVEIEDKKEETNDSNKTEDVEIDNLDIYFDVKDSFYLDLANYMTYSKKSIESEGKTIRVRGFVMTDENYLPNGYFAIGKYGVSCCTADAGYTGFVVKQDNYNIKNNAWYEIEGYLERLTDLSGFDILAIKIANIREIDGSKEEQYVYPCYTYNNENCSEITKYNLGF